MIVTQERLDYLKSQAIYLGEFVNEKGEWVGVVKWKDTGEITIVPRSNATVTQW